MSLLQARSSGNDAGDIGWRLVQLTQGYIL